MRRVPAGISTLQSSVAPSTTASLGVETSPCTTAVLRTSTRSPASIPAVERAGHDDRRRDDLAGHVGVGGQGQRLSLQGDAALDPPRDHELLAARDVALDDNRPSVDHANFLRPASSKSRTAWPGKASIACGYVLSIGLAVDDFIPDRGLTLWRSAQFPALRDELLPLGGGVGIEACGLVEGVIARPQQFAVDVDTEVAAAELDAQPGLGAIGTPE